MVVSWTDQQPWSPPHIPYCWFASYYIGSFMCIWYQIWFLYILNFAFLCYNLCWFERNILLNSVKVHVIFEFEFFYARSLWIISCWTHTQRDTLVWVSFYSADADAAANTDTFAFAFHESIKFIMMQQINSEMKESWATKKKVILEREYLCTYNYAAEWIHKE